MKVASLILVLRRKGRHRSAAVAAHRGAGHLREAVPGGRDCGEGKPAQGVHRHRGEGVHSQVRCSYSKIKFSYEQRGQNLYLLLGRQGLRLQSAFPSPPLYFSMLYPY